MNRIVYLLILLVLWLFNSWGIRLLSISPDIQLLLVISYLCLGALYYGRKKNRVYFVSPNEYFKLIIIGIFLSMLPAYLFWGQSFTQSLITYRFVYYIFAIPLLFKIGATPTEWMKTLKLFSFVLFGVFILKRVFPGLFEWGEYYIVGESDILVGGYSLLTIPFYFSLQQLKEQFNIKDFAYSCFLLSFVFLMSNRSTLFPMVLLMGVTIFRIRSKYKPFIIIVLFFVIVQAFSYTFDTWVDLFEETQAQLNDEDYNRNKAMAYFLYSASPHWLCYILGNGFLSAHANPIMLIMMEQGVYNSDMGFLGFWNQFGLLSTIVMIYMYIRVLISRKYPFFLRLISAHTLICALTISYFASPVHMIYFILFYYYMMCSDNNLESVSSYRKKSIKKNRNVLSTLLE